MGHNVFLTKCLHLISEPSIIEMGGTEEALFLNGKHDLETTLKILRKKN